MIRRSTIVERLGTVLDPELGMNIVDLGLIYDIVQKGRNVRIILSLTYPGCPMGPEITGDITKALEGTEGIGTVHVDIVWEPPWQKEMMEPLVYEELKFMGRIR